MANAPEKAKKPALDPFVASLMPESDRRLASFVGVATILAIAVSFWASMYEAAVDEIMFEEVQSEDLAATMKIEEKKEEIPGVAMIGIDDFAKVELKVAKIKDCVPVKRAKELLELTIDDGSGLRTVASGIAKWYKPEDLVGHNIILVSNLKPAKLCGVESCGMILAADCADDDVKVIFVDDIPVGAKIR